jgi:peptidoglycan hydrolase CwlO-like protein
MKKKIKFKLIVILLLLEITALVVYYVIVNNELKDTKATLSNVTSQNTNAEIDIKRLEDEIPLLIENIVKEKNNLKQIKEVYNPEKLKPYSGYSVNSYTTRKGNRTYTKNYIKYR